jgi:hypothetical protein
MSSLPLPPPESANPAPPVSSTKERCVACDQPVAYWYFRVNGAMHCTLCAQNARNARPKDSSSVYSRALLFGSIAALAGFVFYAAFGIITGWVMTYTSFAVGYLVGKMMMVGSRGIGGRRYQVAAVLLTYAAVSMSAVPIAIVYQVKRSNAIQEQQKAVNLADDQRQLEQEFGSGTTKPIPPRTAPGQQKPDPSRTAPRNPAVRPRPKMNPAAAIAYLVILGLASPILELVNPIPGVIGLVILMVGIIIAWRLTAAKTFEIVGPFRS